MRLGGEPVGRWGLALMAVTGVAGALLAWHGWTSGASAVPSIAGGQAGAGPASASGANRPATSGQVPGTPAATASATSTPAGGRAPAASASASSATKPGGAGPLLKSEPFASVAYQIWPGPVSSTAQLALTGLHVSVRARATGLSVSASVNGQPAGAPHLYVGGARVYVVEATLGDDSGGADYSLADDGLVVTNAQGRIVQ